MTMLGCTLQCVAVCCSELECARVCCSVVQCSTVCCSVLQCVAVCCSVWHTCRLEAGVRMEKHRRTLQYAAECHSAAACGGVRRRVAVCCSVLQCVAVCCSPWDSCTLDAGLRMEIQRRTLQCVAMCCSVLQCVATYCSVLQCVAMCDTYARWKQECE